VRIVFVVALRQGCRTQYVCSIMAECRSKCGVATLCLRGGNVMAMIVERD
jgi:acetyl-CoA acetyltransferase